MANFSGNSGVWLVAFPKGAKKCKRLEIIACRRLLLVEFVLQPSPRSSAGCVVC